MPRSCSPGPLPAVSPGDMPECRGHLTPAPPAAQHLSEGQAMTWQHSSKPAAEYSGTSTQYVSLLLLSGRSTLVRFIPRHGTRGAPQRCRSGCCAMHRVLEALLICTEPPGKIELKVTSCMRHLLLVPAMLYHPCDVCAHTCSRPTPRPPSCCTQAACASHDHTWRHTQPPPSGCLHKETHVPSSRQNH